MSTQTRSRRLRRSAVTALAACAAAGGLTLPAAGLALPAAATAAPVRAAAAEATVRAAASAADSTPRATGAPGTRRPVPHAYHAAMLSAARTGAATAPGAVRGAGLRQVAAGVSTDLPSRVEVRSLYVTVPYTVTVPTSAEDAPAVDLALVDVSGDLVVESFVVGRSGQTTFTGSLTLPSSQLASVGAGRWLLGYGSATHLQTEPVPVPTTMKAGSLLGERVTRTGDVVSVAGALKVWVPYLGYGAHAAQRVYVQRWTSAGWQTIATATTDLDGHVALSRHVPFRVGIRLTTRDTATSFGASTAQAVA